MTKFYAAATRKNVDGKPDYPWFLTYTNGQRVEFVSETSALDTAKSYCAERQHGLYNPRAIAA